MLYTVGVAARPKNYFDPTRIAPPWGYSGNIFLNAFFLYLEFKKNTFWNLHLMEKIRKNNDNSKSCDFFVSSIKTRKIVPENSEKMHSFLRISNTKMQKSSILKL